LARASNIRDKAEAMEAYANQARDPELAGSCAEVKLRALLSLGQL